ncbi:MAG: nucleotidyltransferase family protein [Anaerolineales bacterium]|nr:nucleotidyltransferase family protein [Anaerolineales bacterium]
MRLAAALRLRDGDIIAVMGDSGRLTALFRLADDLVEAGGRVISTTTAPLSTAWLERAPRHLSAFATNRAAVEATLERYAHLLLTGPVDHTLRRAAGVTPGLLETLHAIPGLTAILVNTELSTFDFATRALWVCDAPYNAPALTAPATLLLNQVETLEALEAARRTAADLLTNENVEAVLLGSARKPNAVREIHARVAAIVLAAGRSVRMGRLKQLLPWAGTTLLGEVINRLRATSVFDIVVVTGAEREAVEASLAEVMKTDRRVCCTFNPDFAVGEMARSLQVGLRALPANRQAALVALADQPRIEPAVVEAVLQRWRETQAPVVAPVHAGRRGHPLLVDRALWSALLALPLHANPRDVVEQAAIERVEVGTESIFFDVDTPEDYAQRP